MSLNKFIGIGRFTADPELRQTTNGKSVLGATIACNRDFVTGDHPEADFIEVVAWEKTADFISKYFQKGSEICIEGRLQTRKWEDKDGNKRKTTEIVIERAHFVGKKSDNNSASKNETPQYKSGGTEDFSEIEDDGELPF